MKTKALCTAAAVALATLISIASAQAWTTEQWRTYSYCVKVWARTGGTNAECRYFFTGH
jgi:hypothetical protein